MRTFIQVTAVSVLLLCTIEGLARVWSTLTPDLAEVSVRRSWFRPSADLAWEWQPGFHGMAENDYREFDAQGFLEVDSKQAAEPGPDTVLFLGDSNTMGFGVSTASSFVELIERLLPGVSTVNVAANGYSSYQGRVMLEKRLPTLRPAAVVASFNFNDRVGVRAGEQDSAARFQQLYQSTGNLAVRRFNRFVGYLYSYRAMLSLAELMGMPASDTHDQPVGELHPRVEKAQYRENLTAIVEQTKRAGVLLLFVLLRDSPLQTGHLNRGIEKLEKGEYEPAIEDFNVVIRSAGWHAYLARTYLARTYEVMGKGGEAVEVRGEPGQLAYLDREYNDIMREVAAQYDIPVVDAASALETDPFVFIDFCHFNSDGHRKVAEVLAPALEELLQDSATTSPASRPPQVRNP
jgi:lysophospholipase L1-like esterase